MPVLVLNNTDKMYSFFYSGTVCDDWCAGNPTGANVMRPKSTKVTTVDAASCCVKPAVDSVAPSPSGKDLGFESSGLSSSTLNNVHALFCALAVAAAAFLF